MTATLDVSQFEKVIAAMKKAPEKAIPIFKLAMTDALRILQGELKEYPPSSDANRPGRVHMITLHRKAGDVQAERPQGYYEQGRGWWYPLTKQALKGPTGVNVGQQTEKQAFRRFKVKEPGMLSGYRLIASSEQLGRSWAVDVQQTETAITGEIGTNTSYADYVQGNKMPALFKKRGWRSVDTILKEQTPKIVGVFDNAADEIIKQIGDESL